MSRRPPPGTAGHDDQRRSRMAPGGRMWSESPIRNVGAGAAGEGVQEEYTRIWLPRESGFIDENYTNYGDDYLYQMQTIRLPNDFGAYSGGLGIIASANEYEEAASLDGYEPFGCVFAMHGYEGDIEDYRTGWVERVRLAGAVAPYQGGGWFAPAWQWAAAQQDGDKVLVWGLAEGQYQDDLLQEYPFNKTFHKKLPKIALTFSENTYTHTNPSSGGYPSETPVHNVINYFGPKYQYDHLVDNGWLMYPDYFYIFDWYQFIMLSDSTSVQWWSPYDPITAAVDYSDPLFPNGTFWPWCEYTISGPLGTVTKTLHPGYPDNYGPTGPGNHVGTFTDATSISEHWPTAGTFMTGPELFARIGEYHFTGDLTFPDGSTYSFDETSTYAPLGCVDCGGLWCWLNPVDFSPLNYCHWQYFGSQYDFGARVPTQYWDRWGTWYMKYDEGLVIADGNVTRTFDQSGVYAMGIDFGMWCLWTGRDGQTYGAATRCLGSNIYLSQTPNTGNGGLPGNYDTPPLSWTQVQQRIWDHANGGKWPFGAEITDLVTPPADVPYQNVDPTTGLPSQFTVGTSPTGWDGYDLFPLKYVAPPERMQLHVIEGGGAAQKLWDVVSGQYQPDTGQPYPFYDIPPQLGYLEDGPNPRFWGLSVTNTDEWIPGTYEGPKVSMGWFDSTTPGVNVDSESPRSTVYRAMYATWADLTSGADRILPWWEAVTVTDKLNGMIDSILLQPQRGNGVMTVQKLDAYMNRYDPWSESDPGYMYSGFASPFFKRVGPGAPELWYVQPNGTSATNRSLAFHRMTWNSGTHQWVDQGKVEDFWGGSGWQRYNDYPVVNWFSGDRYSMSQGGWYRTGIPPWSGSGPPYILPSEWVWRPGLGAQALVDGEPFAWEPYWYHTFGFQSTWAEDGSAGINVYGQSYADEDYGGYLWRLRRT